jgi:predicted transcriptional regulator
LEAPITRLIETASEAPKAAAAVIGQLRQEISVSVARDNALLEERTRILGTLSTLLDAINHASTEQRGVIDALLVSSQASLAQTSEQFQLHVAQETDKLGSIAAQVTASAVDVASLGESLGFAVHAFSQTNEQLMAQLKREFGRMVSDATSRVTGKVLNTDDQTRINQETSAQVSL